MLRHTVKLYQAMLGIAPKRLNTVDVVCSTDKFVITEMYSEMLRKAHVDNS